MVFNIEIVCPRCGGTGNVPSGGQTVQCPACLGTGKNVTGTVEGAEQINDLTDKVNDCLDKLNDILEKLNNP